MAHKSQVSIRGDTYQKLQEEAKRLQKPVTELVSDICDAFFKQPGTNWPPQVDVRRGNGGDDVDRQRSAGRK